MHKARRYWIINRFKLDQRIDTPSLSLSLEEEDKVTDLSATNLSEEQLDLNFF